MRKVCKTDFEIMKQFKFYKKDLGHNFHLCTIYGCAGNKLAPWWKRLLSHIYLIVRFEVVEDYAYDFWEWYNSLDDVERENYNIDL